MGVPYFDQTLDVANVKYTNIRCQKPKIELIPNKKRKSFFFHCPRKQERLLVS